MGSRIVKGLEGLGLGQVRICEKGDPFREFAEVSTDLFLATDAEEAKRMLQSVRDVLHPGQAILDGVSVKSPLITLYRELDGLGISICSTHLGAVPTQPWRGVKVWVCEVGLNSEKAKKLAIDLFLSKNTSVRTIDISEHEQVERDQWFTFAVAYLFATALREGKLKLTKFDDFSTLNAELLTLPVGRTLDQGVVVPSEILCTQPRKEEFLSYLKDALQKLEENLGDREKLKVFMQDIISFHDDPIGFVDSIYRKAGVVGARNANLRMHSFSFRITDDRSGRLRELLVPFYKEGANLTAIDSMPGTITQDEEKQGIDPDGIVDFDIGIDPQTITPEKEASIKDKLQKMGVSLT